MLRQQRTLQAIRPVPLPPCRRPASSGTAAPLARPAMTPTRTVSKPLSMASKAPSKWSSLAAYASPDASSEFVEPFSVLETLKDVKAMGGNAGFRAGEDASMVRTTTLLPTTRTPRKDTDSTRSKITRFAARFVAFALVAMMALTAATPSALAARSGGRIGGSAFGGGVGMTASHSFSSSSSHRGAGGRFGGSSYVRTAAPLRSPVYSASSSPARLNSLTLGWGLVPFGGFGYGGYPTVYAGGGGLADFLFFGVFALIAISAITSFTRARSDEDYDYDEDGKAYDDGVTVAKLQVGLLASARGLKKDLERIAARADTSTPAGLHYVLQETVLSLLRNPEYAVYGAAKTLKGKSLSKAEQKFNEMSLAERGKVREETLVNVSGIRREGGFKGKGGGGSTNTAAGDEELIVVTVLVAAKGRFKLPPVRNGAELRTALSTLGAVPSDGVLGVEVLWTPQDPADSYSKGELMIDFPDLNNL